MDESADSATTGAASQGRPSKIRGGLGLLGVVTFLLAVMAVQPLQWNVVTYRAEPSPCERYWPPLAFALLTCAALFALCVWSAWARPPSGRWLAAASGLWPLLLSAPVSFYVFSNEAPPFACSLLMILAAGWTALGAAAHVTTWPSCRIWHQLAVGSILLLIALLAVAHARIQINFFEHFMLGHADIGHFAEELKNALAGRGLRSDSFENTRFGWHFVPLLYVLVPGYAVWPSITYLMVCGALFVHIVALPVYHFARRVSGSVAVGWMFAVAWLLLPSQSRLVYANTYGFQWTTFMMPVLALMIVMGVTNRWRMCLVMVVLVLLCKETAAAATFGWGLYVALFTPRRKTGIVIAVGSLAYFALCSSVIIPHFAAAGRYERLDLFGDLGATTGGVLGGTFAKAGVLAGRLLRREALYYVLVLLTPMALLPLRGWRVLLAALPTLMLILLLENQQWLSIKFWHQCTLLPFLFFAGIVSMRSSGDPAWPVATARKTGPPCTARAEARGSSTTWDCGRSYSNISTCRGIAAAALFCAAWGHYFYGFSPISKAYEPYVANASLHQPDPRLETVRRLRADVPRDHSILATERLAAHFTDYKRLYTGRRIRPADFVLIDRADAWDTSGLPAKARMFAGDPDYKLYGEFGSMVVFSRRPDAPPASPD